MLKISENALVDNFALCENTTNHKQLWFCDLYSEDVVFYIQFQALILGCSGHQNRLQTNTAAQHTTICSTLNKMLQQNVSTTYATLMARLISDGRDCEPYVNQSITGDYGRDCGPSVNRRMGIMAATACHLPLTTVSRRLPICIIFDTVVHSPRFIPWLCGPITAL